MELRDYLRIIRRRWLMIVTTFLIVVAAASLVTYQQTPTYQSRTDLFVSTQASDVSEATAGGTFSVQRVTSYADVATSLATAQQVASNLRLETDVEELSEQIEASVLPQTVILQLTVTDVSPEQAQLIAAELANVMVMTIADLETPPNQRQPLLKATVTQPATLNLAPVSPAPLRNIGLGIVLGALLGLGIAVLRETLDTSVKSGEVASEAAGAPLVGGIAFDAGTSEKPLVTSLDSHAPRLEAFRVLRTNMQFIDVDSDHKVFCVSSSLPGEGKSTTATNLAITLAQADQRVLLIDGDLRRPQVARMLDLEPAVGMTTVLTGQVELEDAVQQWRVPGLDVLTSGALPPNPSELLQSTSMRELVKQCRSRYDVVVIDSPPLLPVTDAALVAAQADGAILVVRHGKTTRDQVAGARANLDNVGGRVLGVVLNMTPSGKRGGKYGYGYGYGYGYAPTLESADPRAARAERKAKRPPGTRVLDKKSTSA